MSRLYAVIVLLSCILTVGLCDDGFCSARSVNQPIRNNHLVVESAKAAQPDKHAAASLSVSKTTAFKQQLQAQRLLMDVLGNVTSGVISASAALDLLKDVAALRASLNDGAAAKRWAQLKAKSQRRQVPSKGILIVAGGRDQFKNAHILLQLLRHPKIGCRLPAELVYYGTREYSASVAEAITEHAEETGTKVTLIDGSRVHEKLNLEPHKPLQQITGFKAKAHALTFVTSFDEVLLLDSDNTPLSDPTYLLDSTAYHSHGNIFWLDFWTNQWMKPVIYSILGLDVPWEVDPGFRASEAGQVVINRVQHYDVLEYLYLLNLHSSSGTPGTANGVVGTCLWGDKDTYPIAFSLAGKSHLLYNIQHKPMQALSKPGHRFVHAGMVQRGLEGELLFLHRTAAGKLWPHCAVHGGQTCVIFGVTTPVDQQQLVASVRDVTMMEFDSQDVDLAWQESHCSSHGYSDSDSSGTAADSNAAAETDPYDDNGDFSGELAKSAPAAQSLGGSEPDTLQQCGTAADINAPAMGPNPIKVTTVACVLSSSIGVLPIPVISVATLPKQVQDMISTTYELFLQSLQQ